MTSRSFLESAAPDDSGGPRTWRAHPAQDTLLIGRPHTTRSSSPNCVFAYQLHADITPEVLADAYREATRRFDALHLTLLTLDELRWAKAPQTRCDITVGRDRLPPSEIPPFLEALARQPFDLVDGPLGAVTIQPSDDGLLIVEAFDHAIADGTSLGLLHEQLVRVINGDNSSTLASSYTELLDAAEQHSNRDVGFWRERFHGHQPLRPENVDTAHTPLISDQLTISRTRFQQLDHAARAAHSTTAALILAAHAHAVARCEGNSDITVLLATNTRPVSHQRTFGQLTRLLPIRIQHGWESPVREQISAVSRTVLRDSHHTAIDPAALADCQAPISLAASNATALIYQSDPVSVPQFGPGYTAHAVSVGNLQHAGGLTTVAHQYPDGRLTISVRATSTGTYAHHLQDFTEMIRLFIDAVIDNPALLLSSDDLMPAPLRTTIDKLSTPTAPYPYTDLGERILNRLQADSQHVVIDTGATQYTASQLHDEISTIGSTLTAADVRRGDAVMVLGENVFRRIAALTALLVRGATYVPLTTDPPHDIAAALSTSYPRVWRLDTSQATVPTRACISSSDREPSNQENAAYIIFTSGSTGKPKGVRIGGVSLSNLVLGEADRFRVGHTSRMLLIAPATTDPWICHVTAALCHGATLVVADPLQSLSETLLRERITHAFLPATLTSTLDTGRYPTLELLATAGDRCQPRALARLLGHGHTVVNIYGPTENTVTSTIATLTEHTDNAIGRPIRGVGARVVIAGSHTAVPPGVTGELLLTGAGLAIDYLADPQRTAHAFPCDSGGRRWYRTGDICRLGQDGQLHFEGRRDRQVKIRGHRVELGHIEHLARQTGLCRDAVASTYCGTDQETRVVLYVEGCASATDLRANLSAHHPPQMTPSRVESVDRLPRKLSGVVDLDALPRWNPDWTSSDDDVAESSALSESWIRVFGQAPEIDADFLRIGADSMDVLRFVQHARHRGIEVTPHDVYSHPRLADLEAAATAAATSNCPVPGEARKARGRSAALGPAQLWLNALNLPQPERWNQQHTIELGADISATDVRHALDDLLAATPILGAIVTNGRFLFDSPQQRPPLLEASLADSDSSLQEVLETLHSAIDPVHGPMLGAVLLHSAAASTLVLAAHHFVVDDWSWSLIEQRLRTRLGHGDQAPAMPDDLGYQLFADTMTRLRTRAEPGQWSELLTQGRTSMMGDLPRTIRRIVRTAPRKPGVRQPDGAAVLAAVSAGLSVIEPGQTSVIDFERNGRTVWADLDLSQAVGWFAVHHPVVVEHRADTAVHAQQLSTLLAAETGTGYAASRWLDRAIDSSAIGRFAVNVTASHSVSETLPSTIQHRLRQCAAPLGGQNLLPYEAVFVSRTRAAHVDFEMSFNPDRITIQDATAVLETAAGAYQSLPTHLQSNLSCRRTSLPDRQTGPAPTEPNTTDLQPALDEG